MSTYNNYSNKDLSYLDVDLIDISHSSEPLEQYNQFTVANRVCNRFVNDKMADCIILPDGTMGRHNWGQPTGGGILCSDVVRNFEKIGCYALNTEDADELCSRYIHPFFHSKKEDIDMTSAYYIDRVDLTVSGGKEYYRDKSLKENNPYVCFRNAIQCINTYDRLRMVSDSYRACMETIKKIDTPYEMVVHDIPVKEKPRYFAEIALPLEAMKAENGLIDREKEQKLIDLCKANCSSVETLQGMTYNPTKVIFGKHWVNKTLLETAEVYKQKDGGEIIYHRVNCLDKENLSLAHTDVRIALPLAKLGAFCKSMQDTFGIEFGEFQFGHGICNEKEAMEKARTFISTMEKTVVNEKNVVANENVQNVQTDKSEKKVIASDKTPKLKPKKKANKPSLMADLFEMT